jgi:beta-lactamase class A
VNNKIMDSGKEPPRKIRIVRVVLTVLIVFLIIFTFLRISGQKKRQAQPENDQSATIPSQVQNNEVSGEDENPAASPTIINSQSKASKLNMKSLENLIKENLEKFPGQPAVIFYDFETGGKVAINSNLVTEAASLIKLPVMLEVYKQISDGSLRPDKELVLRDADKTGGAGVLKDEKAGTRWSVEKLTELMIVFSDNTATDMLIDLVGMDKVEGTIKEIGLTRTTLKRKIFDFDQIDRGLDNLTTAEDMLVLYRELYEGDAFREKYRGIMLNNLKGQKNRKIIPKFLPEEVQVAHKTGGLLGIVHDAGIVYPAKRKPYVLILMSEQVANTEKAEEQFAALSKKIYDFLTESK